MRVWKPQQFISYTSAQDFFKSLRQEFSLIETGHSISLVNSNFKWILSDTRFYSKHLKVLAQLKREVHLNLKKIDGFNDRRRKLYALNEGYFNRGAGELDDVTEMDLSAAYVSSAFFLGLISKTLYETLLHLHKRFRLKVLGAIAARKRVRNFDIDGTLTEERIDEDIDLRRAWFAIVEHTDEFMQCIQKELEGRFIFYWYDNLFGYDLPTDISSKYRFMVKLRPAMLKYQYFHRSLAIHVDDGRVFWFGN